MSMLDLADRRTSLVLALPIAVSVYLPVAALAQGSFLHPKPAPTPAAPNAATPSPSAPTPAAPAASPTPPTSFLPPPSTQAPTPPASSAAPPATPPATPQGGAPIAGTVESYSAEGWPIISGQTIPLAGIDGIAAPFQSGFGAWIKHLGNQLTCQPSGAGTYVCHTLQRIDIAKGAILNGAGHATPDAPPSYQDAEQKAQAAHRGIWH